jgi:signal transduction histidine kinase
MSADPAAPAGASSADAVGAETSLRVDLAVTAGVVLASFVLFAPATSAPARDNGYAVLLSLTLLMAAPLIWRRRRPELVSGVVLLAALLYAVAVGPVPPYAAWLALYSLGVHVKDVRRALLLGAMSLVAVVGVTVVGPLLHRVGAGVVLPQILLTAVVALLAALVRTEAGRLEALRQRARSLERERDAASREASVQERLRIARDLHDLVGHGLSSIAVQSSSARVLLDAGDTGAARQRLQSVEQASRAALQEMRQMLGVLRDTSPAELAPSPGLTQVDELVEAARDMGVDVTVTLRGDLAAVPPTTGIAAYRIIQESLTNAIKHAPDAAVHVDLRVAPTQLHVQVRSTGVRRPPRENAGGHGLQGMAERVALLHGTFAAGPTDDGWDVTAVLPLGPG